MKINKIYLIKNSKIDMYFKKIIFNQNYLQSKESLNGNTSNRI